MNVHLSEDQLLDRLYGIGGGEGEMHLESCPDCKLRWNRLRARREELACSEEASTGFLAAQRRNIYARLGEQPGRAMKWAPALAAACLLAVGIFLYHPAAAHHAPVPPTDAQLFSDVYSMEQSVEPRVAAPIHELFEDNQ